MQSLKRLKALTNLPGATVLAGNANQSTDLETGSKIAMQSISIVNNYSPATFSSVELATAIAIRQYSPGLVSRQDMACHA